MVAVTNEEGKITGKLLPYSWEENGICFGDEMAVSPIFGRLVPPILGYDEPFGPGPMGASVRCEAKEGIRA